MKTFLLITTILITSHVSYAQSVSVNNDGSAPHASAMLDVKSPTKGMLLPRTSTVTRVAMLSPAKGLIVYDTTAGSFYFYNGAAWNALATGAADNWTLSGSDIYNNNGGNVGIGSINPTTKLTIQTPINTAGWVHIGGADSIIVSEGIGGVSAAIGTATNHAFRLNTNSTGRLHIYSGGEVVVGSSSSPIFSKFTVETPNNSFGISHTSTGGNILSTNIGGTSAGIGTFSNTNMRIFCNSTSAMLIAAATGNVGIGTDNPLYKLDVQTPNNSWGIAHTSTGGNIIATQIGGTSAGIGTFSNTNMRIFCNGTSAMLIAAATGNVGIGTDNPTYKLSVNGNIRSKEVVVEIGWADYVFDKAYKLRSLPEVESYINEHNHLPGIPSAAEIETNGLHLGDIQKKMMEKIEELTLYIIDMKKEIESLKKDKL